MNLDWKVIGARIRELRKNNNITIERLCEIIGVSPSFIGLVERGESGVSIEKLCTLSQVFNVSLDYLIKGEEASTTKPSSKFDELHAVLFDYTEEEVAFLIELAKFLKPRVSVKSHDSTAE